MWGLSFNLLSVMLCIPFYTLLERKILSYIQLRKGPNKVGFLGIIQPITDGVKLLSKEGTFPKSVKKLLYWGSPLLSFVLMCFIWLLFPSNFTPSVIGWSILLFLCWSAMGVYSILGSGWASNSKYSFLGSIRGAAQSISYEIVLFTLIFYPLFLSKKYMLGDFLEYPISSHLNPMFLMVLFILLLCETNRAPFDFAEGESELVSGFNTEFSGLSFTYLFMGEYGNILFSSTLISLFLMSGIWWLFPLSVTTVSLAFLFSRGSYPRYRYDLLMSLCWGSLLPISLAFLCSYSLV